MTKEKLIVDHMKEQTYGYHQDDFFFLDDSRNLVVIFESKTALNIYNYCNPLIEQSDLN